MENFKWNYLLELGNISKDNKDKDKDHSDGTDDEVCGDESESDVEERSNATSSPTMSNKKRKHNVIDVSMMVTPGHDNMVKPDIAKSYWYLLWTY